MMIPVALHGQNPVRIVDHILWTICIWLEVNGVISLSSVEYDIDIHGKVHQTSFDSFMSDKICHELHSTTVISQ